MSIRLVSPSFVVAAAALLLAGCGPSVNQANPENSRGDDDPALTSALEDQILVDPSLSQQSNRNTVRPPETPLQAPYPKGSGSKSARAGGCADGFDYDPAWASRLPDAFPLYPGARLKEAAGNDAGECSLRVATFRVTAEWPQVLDFYERKAAAAGFSAERQVRGGDHILGGANEQTEGAYYLIVTPVTGGSDVALIAHLGR